MARPEKPWPPGIDAIVTDAKIRSALAGRLASVTEDEMRVAKAMLDSLARRSDEGGEHGCMLGVCSPDMDVSVSGHIWLIDLARDAIAAMKPKQ